MQLPSRMLIAQINTWPLLDKCQVNRNLLVSQRTNPKTPSTTQGVLEETQNVDNRRLNTRRCSSSNSFHTVHGTYIECIFA